MNEIDKPIIAITMGDPCGIGPEVIVKGLLDKKIYDTCRPFVIGNADWMMQAASHFAPSLDVCSIKDLKDGRFEAGMLDILDLAQELGPFPFQYGNPHPAAASMALSAIILAARMALRSEIDGIATGPIHKEQMQRIGFSFPGHTEFFADMAKTDAFGMMMVGGGLRILLTTIHLSLKEMIGQIKKERIYDAIRLTAASLERDFGCQEPRLAVAALNPHAGERGIFGDEEKREVLPAIEMAQADGIGVSGPYPADTLFYQLKQGRFDAAVALYHDQALIPIKLLAFGSAVNVTVGLPFVRSSVDHGTAYDIAGQGVADAGSLQEAVRLAVQMARHRAGFLRRSAQGRID
ncbi:MAG: 4-hydroxythreonine-4-phosphate dehydrogenase PdxA [Nitrospira sp.]|nr:4-hydroxythreonine-4-phosphate dehydrogenase PdxA [Candidatus Manganitrophaceae bacterium]